MEYFKCFVEDYNTATMPHKKYYNYNKWEMKEYRRKQQKSSNSVELVDSHDFSFDDEKQKALEVKRQREEESRAQYLAIKQQMKEDKEKREELQTQEVMRNQLKMAYRLGNKEEVKRLEKLLAPSKPKDDDDMIPPSWAYEP